MMSAGWAVKQFDQHTIKRGSKGTEGHREDGHTGKAQWRNSERTAIHEPRREAKMKNKAGILPTPSSGTAASRTRPQDISVAKVTQTAAFCYSIPN